MLKFKGQAARDMAGDSNSTLVPVLRGKDGEKFFWEMYGQDFKKAPWRLGLNADHWQKQGYHIAAYQRPLEGSPIDIARLEFRIKDATKDDWFEALKLGPPLKMMKHREVFKEFSKNHRIIHFTLAPPILTEREAVLEWKRIDLNEKESMLVIQSVEIEEIPIKPNILRGEVFKAQLIRQDENSPSDLLVSDVSNIDLKGSIPPRLLNMTMTTVLSKGIGDVISHLRTVVQKK